MRKVYKKLTNDQIGRGVIFSSQLQPGTIIHEVFVTDSKKEQEEKIERLLNDSFFNDSPYKFNEIRR